MHTAVLTPHVQSGQYRIEQTEYGVLLFGEVPVTDFVALGKAWQKKGYDSMVFGIAHALGATFAVCAARDTDAWRKAVDAQALVRADGDPELAWLFGTDTGVSSCSIFYVLSQHRGRVQVQWHNRFRYGVPNDPDDFGRCHRLLELFPAWRERLPEVGQMFLDWIPYAEQWAELTALYLEELPRGLCPKLYDRLQQMENGK